VKDFWEQQVTGMIQGIHLPAAHVCFQPTSTNRSQQWRRFSCVSSPSGNTLDARRTVATLGGTQCGIDQLNEQLPLDINSRNEEGVITPGVFATNQSFSVSLSRMSMLCGRGCTRRDALGLSPSL
jgi:hypothetical protein